MKVAVLMGGKSFEREGALASGKGACEAREEAGHKVVPLDTNADLVPTLRSERPDVVYNALHGKHGVKCHRQHDDDAHAEGIAVSQEHGVERRLPKHLFIDAVTDLLSFHGSSLLAWILTLQYTAHRGRGQ